MGKGGGGSNTTVQKADPWKGVQGYLEDLYGRAQNYANTSQPFYPYQTYANFNPLQIEGMQGTVDYARNGLAPGIFGFQNQLNQAINAPMDITNDPAVQNMMAANASNVTDTLTREWLPRIGRGATAAGQYGGSRQGIAEGLAVEGAEKALANANAQTALGAYGDAIKLAGLGISATPNALQMGFAPSEAVSNVGGILQGQTQKGIDEAMARFYYPKQEELERLGAYNQLLGSGLSFGTQTTQGPGSSSAAGALGGGLLGYGLMNSLPGFMGLGAGGMGPSSLLAPSMSWLGPAGAIGGAILGGLFS